MHKLANPFIFQNFYRVFYPLLSGLGLLTFLAGMVLVFTDFRPDYLQGYTVVILYIHVPSAWLASGFYIVMALSSAGFLIWRHPLAMVSVKAAAPVGMSFAAITLITGMFWAKPTWGAWWVWDSRLVSVLIILWIYLAIMILIRSTTRQQIGDTVIALFVIAGTCILPIIHFSVVFWNSIHQGQSISLVGDNKLESSMLLPLWLVIIGASLIGIGLHLYGMKTHVLQRKEERLMQRLYQRQG